MSGTLLLESLDSRQAGLELDGLNTCALVIHLQTTDLVFANGFFFVLSVCLRGKWRTRVRSGWILRSIAESSSFHWVFTAPSSPWHSSLTFLINRNLV